MIQAVGGSSPLAHLAHPEGKPRYGVSLENVEIVRRLREAVDRRDFDAMLETGDPEIEIVKLMAGTYRGHAE